MQLWCLNAIRRHSKKLSYNNALPAGLILLALLTSASTAAQPSGLFGGSRPSFLDVDEAFRFYSSLDSDDSVSIHWTVAPEYYLYQDKFGFSLVAPNGDTVELQTTLPAGTQHQDEFFGDVVVYYGTLTTPLALPADVNNDDSYKLQIRYQGCADAGLCYPPQTRLLEIAP